MMKMIKEQSYNKIHYKFLKVMRAFKTFWQVLISDKFFVMTSALINEQLIDYKYESLGYRSAEIIQGSKVFMDSIFEGNLEFKCTTTVKTPQENMTEYLSLVEEINKIR